MIALMGMGFSDLLCWSIVVPAFVILGFRSFAKSADRRPLVIKWVGSALLILIAAWIASWRTPLKPLWLILPFAVLGIMWIPNIFNILVKPLTSTFDGGTDEVEVKPYYYAAEGKRRKGLYQEAILEVRKQLEQFPGDIEGMMKVAAIQAEDLHDVPAAAATLEELLLQPDLPPANAVGALQTLADWQLQIASDPAAARSTLERVIHMFPDSAVSHGAEQRLAHLERVTETRQFREHAVFKVTAGPRDLGLRKPLTPQVPAEDEAGALADQYVQQLEKHPNDTETRENLALLYAEQFGRLDLAVGQLEQLTTLPNETPKHTAHWLDLLATVHIRHGHDLESARNALQQIIDRFPNSGLATRANERLMTLQGELKAADTAVVAKALGVYEKDKGLKSGSGVRRFGA